MHPKVERKLFWIYIQEEIAKYVLVFAFTAFTLWVFQGCAPQQPQSQPNITVNVTIDGEQTRVRDSRAGKEAGAAEAKTADGLKTGRVPYFRGYRVLPEYNNSTSCKAMGGTLFDSTSTPLVVEAVQKQLLGQGATLAYTENDRRPQHSVLLVVCIWNISQQLGGAAGYDGIVMVSVQAVVGAYVAGAGMGRRNFCTATNRLCSGSERSYEAVSSAATEAMDELIRALPSRAAAE